MKFLIVLGCALAIASASVNHVVHYSGAPQFVGGQVFQHQHLPVIGSNGVPLETPAVQQAKAAHFVAKAEVEARNGDYLKPVVEQFYQEPFVRSQVVASPVVAHYKEEHIPVIGANGVPVETADVQQAKAEHFAAKVEAHVRNGNYVKPVVSSVVSPVVGSHFVQAPVVSAYTGEQHIPVIGANGVPVETADVQKAKAEHFAHKVEAHARNGDFVKSVVAPVVESQYVAPVVQAKYVAPVISTYTQEQHIPVIGANGVPVETADVQQAKAEHFAAKVEAHVRNGDYVKPVVAPVVQSHYVAPVVQAKYVAPVVSAYTQEQHIPVIGATGVPVETAEVQQAKAEHFASKVEAHVRNGDYVKPVVGSYVAGARYATPVYQNYATPVVSSYVQEQHIPVIGATGVPVETAEVQQAKAEHFAAKLEAHSRNGEYVHSEVVSAPLVHTKVFTGAKLYSSPLAYTTQGFNKYVGTAYPSKVVSTYTAYPYSHVYRAKRGIPSPVTYTRYAPTPYVSTASYYYPYHQY